MKYHNSFICFSTMRDLIDETSFELLEDPKFLNVSDKIKHRLLMQPEKPYLNLIDQEVLPANLVRNYKYIRIVITTEYLEKIKCSGDIDTKYQFKEYTIKNTGKTFVISKELELSKFHSNCSDILELFADFCLSILLVNDSHAIVPSYGFTSPYSGWHFIAFPFICMLRDSLRFQKSSFVAVLFIYLNPRDTARLGFVLNCLGTKKVEFIVFIVAEIRQDFLQQLLG